ncbi:4-phosphoerythronate dehydrogenase [uncultured Victivallis sp.]|uniref:4-phosphoerythronate dehydrogenase n=1 Tax=uncultured Victivallis sp. TaxID=354118 RepID=UPI0025EBCAA0|nr:4-phosphoerythronate dehydrogenase [uncultured Victivallis sp.]
MRIVADDKIPFLKGVFEPYAEVRYLPGGAIRQEDLRNADALITRTRTRCNRELLAGTPVRLIATATIGFDHIDAAAMKELEIDWTNAPGCNARGVAGYLAAALTGFQRPLRGLTLGVVGVGNVGRRIVETGEALGMRVLRNDPPRAEREGSAGFSELAQLLEESDFITLHVPLERGGAHPTFHLADEVFLNAMKPGAVLLNTSRGEVADNPALKRALLAGTLRAAVLDVWENEPEIDRELLAQVFRGTPHIAGYSADGKANGTAMAVQAVARKFGIEPLYEWRPSALPAPEPATIDLAAAASPEEQLALACNTACDLLRDDADLRRDPGRFEQLRGNYRIRREAPAYTIRGGSGEVRDTLKRLDFRLG